MKHKNTPVSRGILFKSIMIALLLGASFISRSQTISTFAGNGVKSYSGDAGPATAAELSAPYGVAIDASGNVYIADEGNERVREVNTSGVISTFAGTKKASYSGDGGPATAADLDTPYGVAVDASGNVYIADAGDDVIREVNTSGVISTFAGKDKAGYSGNGGQASAADLSAPYGVAVDASGNVYIADEGNNVIREVNTSGLISTIAGDDKSGYSGDGGQATAAELHGPEGVAVDASGNVYITDYSNQRVREVNTSGIISTFAGNGANGYSGDGGQATAADLSDPKGVGVDASGNVYITEFYDLVLKVNTSGIISTFAGSYQNASFSGDGGPATAADISTPFGVAAYASGKIYIADYGNNRIREVTIPFSVTANATANVSCYGGNNGSLSATANAGTAPYTYSWSNGGGNNSTVSGLSAGTYTITVTDFASSTASATVTITQPNVLSTTASVITNACNATNNGNAMATISGGTSPYTYSWSNSVTTNPTGATLSAGNYTVTVHDSCGNSATAAVTINGSSAIIATASVTTPICYGQTNGIATAGATGGASPYTYSWNSGGGTNASISSYSQTFSYESAVQHFTVPAGVSQVSIAIAGAQGGGAGGDGASFMGVCTVTSGDILSVVVGQQGISSTSPDAGGGGGGSFVYDSNTVLYNPSGTTGLLAVAAGGGGGYNAISGGAGGTDLIGNSTTNGAGGSTAVGGAGGSGGGAGDDAGSDGGGGGAGWLSNGVTGSGSGYGYGGDDEANHFTGGATGTYGGPGGYGGGGGAGVGGGGGGGYNGGGGGFYGVVPGGGGGGGGGSYFNTAYGSLPVTVTANNTGNGSVTISPSSNTGIIAGTYMVTVTDANGCTATASVSLSQPTALTTTASITGTCYGETTAASANPSGGTSPYTYSWSGSGETNSIVSGLSAGNYTVTVQDGCGGTVTVSVNIPNPLSATANVVSNACSGTNSGIALATPSGGTSPYTYSWSGGGGTNSYASGLSGGTYTVTVQDAGSCSNTASVTIYKSNVITATGFVSNPISCYGASNGLAKVAGVGGGAVPYTYSWSNGSGIYIASNLSPGAYSVTITDKNGCSSTESVTVTQPALLRDSVASISYPLCLGSTGSATIGVKGGTTPYRYLWAPNTSDNTAIASGVIVQRTYSVQVRDQNGCFNNLTFSISQPPVLHDSIVSGFTVNTTCGQSNGSATVGVKYGISPYTYSWSGGAGNNATASGLSSGTYTITVNDAGSCSASTSVSIAKSAAIAMTPVVSNPITCNGASNGLAKVATITGGAAPYTYSWSNGSGIYIASNLSVGTYSVTVTDKTGCISTAAVTVSQPATLRDSVASLSSPPCTGGGTGSATIGVMGGTSPYRYAWAPNISTTDSAEGLTVRSYTVLARDNNGCGSYVYFSVSCSETVEAPQSNSVPGMDNINLYPNPNTGQFTLSGLQKDMILEVYDYTGKKISSISSSGETMQLNIFNQANGIYLVRILDKDGNLVSEKKVVKTQ